MQVANKHEKEFNVIIKEINDHNQMTFHTHQTDAEKTSLTKLDISEQVELQDMLCKLIQSLF